MPNKKKKKNKKNAAKRVTTRDNLAATKNTDRFTPLVLTFFPPTSPKNSSDSLNNLLAFFSTHELTLVFNLSKQTKVIFTCYFATIVPWQYYQIRGKKIIAVRDYLTIDYLKRLSQDIANIDKIREIISTLKISSLFVTPTSHVLNTDESAEWKKLLALTKQRTRDLIPESKQKILSKLTRLREKDPKATLEKLTSYFANDTAIVSSFKFPLLTTKQNEFFNYFQMLKLEGAKIPSDAPKYLNGRLTVEFFRVADFPTSLVQAALASPAFCYGTLQDQRRIEAVIEYGKNFVVFRPALRDFAAVVFGSPLNHLLNKKQHRKPVSLSGSLEPLVAQFPKKIMGAYLKKIKQGFFPPEFSQQYLEDETTYTEVQFQRSISLTDPEFVGHLHFDQSTIPPIPELLKLDSRISFSIGSNPFESSLFSRCYFGPPDVKPFLRDEIFKTFLCEEITKYIYQAALLIGETDSDHLTFSYAPEALTFTFTITPNDASGFHQAQAAAILYLLGVRKFFETTSAIFLSETNIHYVLPLSGYERQEGGLTDHDVYTNDPRSLAKLLNIFIKRILSILLVSEQNAESLRKHNKPHAITGRGAIEELLQTSPLHIAPEGFLSSFEVLWSYDTVLIKGKSLIDDLDSRVNQWIYEKICSIFDANDKPSFNLEHILIAMPLSKILENFREKWMSYKTVIIHDEDENPGNIFLALRQDVGFATEGGKHLNPFSMITALSDLEFMRSKRSYVELEKDLKVIGTSKGPSTAYYLLPSRLTDDRELDTKEFAPNSLHSFPIHTLGNLTDDQLDTVCVLFKKTRAQYQALFGRALPLAPYPFLDVYLKYYEGEIARFFYFKINKEVLTSDKVEVSIVRDYKKSTLHHFLLPAASFGKMRITVKDPSSARIIHESLLKKTVGNFLYTYNPNSFEKLHTFELTGVNPHKILMLAKGMALSKREQLLSDLAKFVKEAEEYPISNIVIDPEKLFFCLKDSVKLMPDIALEKFSLYTNKIFVRIIIKYISKIPDEKIDEDTLRMLQKLHSEGNRYLEELVLRNRLPLIKRLMERMRINVNLAQYDYNRVPLLLSRDCHKADLAMLEYFFSCGYDVNAQHVSCKTLLHIKADLGDLACVKFLVNTCKAKRNVYYGNRVSPLWSTKSFEVFEFLKSSEPFIPAFQHLVDFKNITSYLFPEVIPAHLISILIDVIKEKPELNLPEFLEGHARGVEKILRDEYAEYISSSRAIPTSFQILCGKFKITEASIREELRKKEHASGGALPKLSFLAPVVVKDKPDVSAPEKEDSLAKKSRHGRTL